MIINGKVSVVITTYKRELDILCQAIESVIGQTYHNIEVIVIDDNGVGSLYQEQNEQKLKQYGEKILYKPNVKNSGVQFSRNRGILESCGEFIAFLDDDDIWAPHKIEEQLKPFEDSDVGLVYCDGYRFNDDNPESRTQFYQDYTITGENITFDMMIDRDYVGSTSHPLIRKECLAKVGIFDTKMPARQDYEMWLRIAKGGYKVIGINQQLFYYRCHQGERISTNSQKCYDSYSILLKMYRNEYNRRKHSYAKASRLMQLCKHAFLLKKPIKSAIHLVNAFFVNPKQFFDTLKRRKANNK